MPELPEVETIKETLKQLVVGKIIDRVTVNLPRIIRKPDRLEFAAILEGKEILKIRRRGKFLLFDLSDDWTIVSHLRMEGNYGLYQSSEPVAKHVHVIFHFTDGTELRYRDTRQFGTMDLVRTDAVDEDKSIRSLGPEPWDDKLTADYLFSKFQRRQGPIKTVLLDQNILVGIGNIYADEILFLSKINPNRPGGSLSLAESETILKATREVLAQAIKMGGTSIKSYVNGKGEMGMFQQTLQVYQQNGKPCQECADEIIKIKLAGRGTHYCPSCQK